jgi:hypothetical protein
VSFGKSTTFFTFDNAAGLTGPITALSVAGRNGAVTVSGATGSPGTIATNGAQVTAGGAVTGLVPAQLALTLGAPATFAPFIAGAAKDYDAQTTATVTSTGGDAVLSVVDANPVAPGHLVNGTFPLPQALQVNAKGGAYAPVSATPAALVTYSAPVSNDVVNIGVKQTIGASDALRTGAYAKTLTFTLSTTTQSRRRGRHRHRRWRWCAGLWALRSTARKWAAVRSACAGAWQRGRASRPDAACRRYAHGGGEGRRARAR